MFGKVKENPPKGIRKSNKVYKFRKFLIRYDKINYNDEPSAVNDLIFNSVKKPLIKWSFNIFISSLPIFLLLCSFFPGQLLVTPQILIIKALGISLAWYLIIEFKKDWRAK